MKLRISLFKKLIIANVFYSIPVIALVWLMVDAKNGNIDFGKQEIKGNYFQITLEKALLEFSRLRMTNLSQNTISENDFTKIDAALTELNGEQIKLGNDLQFNEEGFKKRNREKLILSKFQERWANFKNVFKQKNKTEINNELSDFITDIHGMITHVGDTSNLILDPDLDSFYLMDITLVALPQMQDRIQDITASIANKININKKENNNSLSEQDKIDIAVYSALLKQSDIDRIITDMQTVIQEDPNFYGVSETLKSKLDPEIQSLAKEVNTFIDYLKKIGENPQTRPTANEFIDRSIKLQDLSFAVWTSSQIELNTLLNKRIDALENDKNISLARALLALAVAGFILFWIAKSFNSNIKNILNQLKVTLVETRQASSQLVNLSSKLSNSTQEQASAVQETATALEEINSLVKSTVSNTENANLTAKKSLEEAERSGQSVDNLSEAMKEIANNNEHIRTLMENNNKKMSQITNIISSIGDKTKVINDIVFQTKLLSFNASVEAARAGESGKGFSVVAEEVGTLATMSGSASQEISGMLENSIKEVQKISFDTKSEIEKAILNGQNNIENGKISVELFSQTVFEILNQFKTLKENVDSITRAASEQAIGIQEITDAIGRIDTITNENASMSRQTANQSESIENQSRILEKIVSTIEEEILGAKTQSESKA